MGVYMIVNVFVFAHDGNVYVHCESVCARLWMSLCMIANGFVHVYECVCALHGVDVCCAHMHDECVVYMD